MHKINIKCNYSNNMHVLLFNFFKRSTNQLERSGFFIVKSSR
jgi:hypothetical protein